jgi:hypothetical protein
MAKRGGIVDISRVREMKRRLQDLLSTRIKVGIIDNPELALIGITNELGTDKAGAGRNITIPERSFMRSTADSRKTTREAMAKSSDVIDINKPALKPLNVIGIQFAEAVREKIRSNIPPENAPSTIAAKGGARTLIGKLSRLVGEVKHEVV